ncbi:DUF1697 domain-containing protein [Nakamurella endophytica]|uniref:DUF1697 domain-containing protein n=1 Tax=Nakamurella endophytica TaxID=1748367 RepID=A0A917WLV8_9ACTN|nr:DUF1697 domain-containing protein [Nakamurella endophytica]GGM14458.1 hypothetical protein GCM10011594_38100 [Nakamurella endophytica]
MTRWVVLLKGVNVGRANRIKMADFRSLLADLGAERVTTVLQSGNAVLDSSLSGAELCDGVRRGLAAAGVDVPVVVRTGDRFAAAMDEDPLGEVATDPARHLLGFLSATPAAAAVAALDEAVRRRQARGGKDSDDRYVMVGDHVHLWCASSVHESVFATVDWDRLLGVTVTMRNWGTAAKLRDLLAG